MRRQVLPERPDQEFLVCMGFDAMRIAMGLAPKNYPVQEVTMWVQSIAAELQKAAK